MANIGTVLREEILRLARREIRGQVQAVKKASAQYRRHIAALKRQVATLEGQVAAFLRRSLEKPSAAKSSPTMTKVRFVAKGLRAQRGRLGLSAADYGKLAGVSAQSIYNWEQGHVKPRAEQLAALATLRSIGKREARAHLNALDARTTKKRRKT
jgi:DNA-binding transcriptional regulator YiaG